MAKTQTKQASPVTKPQSTTNRRATVFKILVTVIIALFALANWMKGPFWGIHFYSYIGNVFAYICIAVISLIWFLPSKFFIELPAVLFKQPKGKIIIGSIAAVGLSLIFFSVFKNNPIRSDIYGDARNFHKALERDTINGIESKWVKEVTSLNIAGKSNGETFVFNSIRIIRAIFKCNTAKAFSIWNAFWGAIFIFSITLFVFVLYDSWIKILLGLILGYTTGFVLCYYGYSEIYAAPVTLIFLYLISLFAFIRKGKILWVLPVIFLLFMCIKAHITSVCLAPSLLLAFLYVYREKIRLPLKLENNRSIILFFIIPGIILFMMVYFGLQNHNSSHIYIPAQSKVTKHVFLPMVKEAPPQNRYTFYSSGHLIDYLNIILFWSIPCIILLLWYYSRSSIKGNNGLIVKIFLLNFLVYAGMFFMVNPILSMPRDWDLMSLPAASLLFLTLVIIYYISIEKTEKIHTKIFTLITVFAAIGTCVYFVNTTPKLLAPRLVNVGTWVYRTYWGGSSYIVNVGFKVAPIDTVELIKQREIIVKDLEPFAVKGKDTQYGDLLMKLGDLYLAKKEYNKATSTYLKSLKYAYSPNTAYNLAYLYYMAGNFQEALNYSRASVNAIANDPNKLLLCIEIELRNNQRAQAKELCAYYLKLIPNDGRIIQLMQSL